MAHIRRFFMGQDKPRRKEDLSLEDVAALEKNLYILAGGGTVEDRKLKKKPVPPVKERQGNWQEWQRPRRNRWS